jgi:hypothetical protein
MIPYIRAGMSGWGTGVIDGIPTEAWMDSIIQRLHSHTNNLDSFASLLANELNSVIPPGSLESGFHLAGYVPTDHGPLPSFYNVHNGPSEYFTNINPAIFNANLYFPPHVYVLGNPLYMRNGNYQLYAQFFDYFKGFLDGIPSNPAFRGIEIPSPDNLYSQAKLLRLQIQTVSGLYDVSNRIPNIGGPVTILGIGPNGYEFYETK